MAMIKMGPGIENISGKVGGVIFRSDVCGPHIQAFPRIIKPRKESKSQKAFTRAKNAWSERKWTQYELDLWWVWCYNHPKTNKKGETTYLHPFLAFLSVNTKRILDGKEIIYEPST